VSERAFWIGTAVVCVLNAVVGGAVGYFLDWKWVIVTAPAGFLTGGYYGFRVGRTVRASRP
jgi:uncharacterized protein YcfJ